MRSRRKRASGSEYSEMIRTSRPSGLLTNAGFWYERGARMRSGGLPVLCFMLSRVGSTEVHGFHDRDPQIQQAEARDHPAHCPVHQKRGHAWKVVNELIVCPQRRVPG